MIQLNKKNQINEIKKIEAHRLENDKIKGF